MVGSDGDYEQEIMFHPFEATSQSLLVAKAHLPSTPAVAPACSGNEARRWLPVWLPTRQTVKFELLYLVRELSELDSILYSYEYDRWRT